MPRKSFDGIRLAHDVAQMQAADKVSPPSARPSMMDVVRQFATYIDTRARLGWTDAMIAVVLTEAGYAIDAATLRSYRKRLRDEGLLPALERKAPNQPTPAPATAHTQAAARQIPTTAPVLGKIGVIDATMSIADSKIDGTMTRAPPDVAPAPAKPTPRRFSIDPTKRPIDRA